jgi:hypothetical protein
VEGVAPDAEGEQALIGERSKRRLANRHIICDMVSLAKVLRWAAWRTLWDLPLFVRRWRSFAADGSVNPQSKTG